MTEYKVNSIVRLFRADSWTGIGGIDSAGNGIIDPMQASQWQLLSGVGNIDRMSNFVHDYAAWNMLLQMRNTLSTDLAYRFDKNTNKLYINVASNTPSKITVEYVPRYDDVSEITSDYWIDMIIRLSVALAKITIGRIRTRYTQSNALWVQDGDRLLSEGTEELRDLRERLTANTQLCYPID